MVDFWWVQTHDAHTTWDFPSSNPWTRSVRRKIRAFVKPYGFIDVCYRTAPPTVVCRLCRIYICGRRGNVHVRDRRSLSAKRAFGADAAVRIHSFSTGPKPAPIAARHRVDRMPMGHRPGRFGRLVAKRRLPGRLSRALPDRTTKNARGHGGCKERPQPRSGIGITE